MSRGPRLLLDTLVAAFLIGALGAVSLFDRIAPKVPLNNTDATTVSPGDVSRRPLVRLAVIRGTFDDMGRLLETLGPGYRFEEVAEETLRDPSISTRFDAVFLTCDDHSKAPVGAPLGPSLREFVTRGGTLYASDLRFDDLKAAFPEFVDANSVTQGVKQDSLKAAVTDPGLRDVLGAELPLHFDLDGWRPAAFGGPGVTVYLKGSVPTTAGVSIDAPLMVKFNCGKGSVLFTSFHNTKQNSEDEAKLLKFLVLSTVTAGVDSGLVESLEKGGFTRVASSLIEAEPGKPSKTRRFDNKASGKLVFSLGFEPRGAKLKLVVHGPNGYSREKEGSSTFSLDVPEAAKGEWTYTATAEKVPYENFPFTLGVGAEMPRGERTVAAAVPAVPRRSASGVGGNAVKFRVVPTETLMGVAEGTTRIAVTKPNFDDMGKLLGALGSGYRFDVVTMNDIRNSRTLDRYDILFLTCDVWPGEWSEGGSTATNRDGVVRGSVNQAYMDQVVASLRRFVTNGGTLYASDLRYDCVTKTFPSRSFFHVNKRLFEDLQAAESEMVAEMAPMAKVATVEECLRTAGLSPPLLGSVRAVSAMIMEANLDDMRPSNLFFDARSQLRSRLEGWVRATDADVNVIYSALTTRTETIRRSQAARAKKALEKSRRKWPALKQRYDDLRRKITPEVGGSGTKQSLAAQVVDPGLREQLGETIALDFNTPDWIPASFLGTDQTVLLRGEYEATGGGKEVAPLLVRFKEGKGNVIFTSFHNERQNSRQEESLLRYLVFTTVTAKAEEAAAVSMRSGGYFPAGRSLQSHSSGQPSLTRSYVPKKPGALRFALTFSGQGAAMKLTLTAPNGQTFEQETNSTLIVEATGSPPGEWHYTVTAVRVPHENFPYSVNISEGGP